MAVADVGAPVVADMRLPHSQLLQYAAARFGPDAALTQANQLVLQLLKHLDQGIY